MGEEKKVFETLTLKLFMVAKIAVQKMDLSSEAYLRRNPQLEA